MDAAPVNLVQARVLLLDSGTAEAVGIRQGLPSATIGAGEQRSLLGTVLTGNSPHEYENLLGIHASGLGPWRATAVRVTYRDGGSTRSQTFSHDLTICEPSQAQCSPVGRYTVDAAIPRNTVGCGGSKSFVSGRPERQWLATNLSSNWVGTGGTIEFHQTSTASFSESASFTEEAGAVGIFPFAFFDVVATAQERFHVGVTRRTSSTQSWGYDVTVPPNLPKGARATVYIYAWALPTTTVTDATKGGSCQATYSYGTVYAPASNTDPHDQYCVTLDPWPGVRDLGLFCHSSRI